MNKLSLSLDELRVDSFATETDESRPAMQVHGAQVTERTMHCGGTCFESCWTDC